MARLKKDHSGYRSSGLHKKWQGLPLEDKPMPRSKAKNTAKWCKGKVNIPHQLYRRSKKAYIADKGYISLGYTETFCKNCNKRFWRKTGVPLTIDIEHKRKITPIPVKINGTLQKLSNDWYKYKQCWCGGYHNNDFIDSIKADNLRGIL